MINETERLCETLGIAIEMLLNQNKCNEYVSACRQGVAYYFRLKMLTLEHIGTIINRHHTTVSYSVKRFGELLEVKDKVAVGIWDKICYYDTLKDE